MLCIKDGRLFGTENGKSYVFITNSTSTTVIDKFIERCLTSHEETLCLEDLFETDFIETDKDGHII